MAIEAHVLEEKTSKKERKKSPNIRNKKKILYFKSDKNKFFFSRTIKKYQACWSTTWRMGRTSVIKYDLDERNSEMQKEKENIQVNLM